MHSSLISLLAVVTSAIAVPAFERQFVTEETVKRAPSVDLSAFGYYGKNIPRVYEFSGNEFAYSARRSLEHFNDILAGRANATGPERRDLAKREDHIDIKTIGTNGKTDDWGQLAADKSCRSGINRPYQTVIVYGATDVYVTFWDSDVCNKGKMSFNPTCNSQEIQTCKLKANPQSFRVYSGCHEKYNSDCQS